MGKVILLADCRCGGTVLRKTLGSHPDLHLAGEALHPLAPRPTDWAAWISEMFAGHDGSHLQRYQLPRDSEAWSMLARLPDIRVIDLRREDKVEQYASWKLAMVTSSWHTRPETLPRIKWNQEECKSKMREWAEGQRLTERIFAGVPTLRITFEQIADDIGGVLYRCQRFLGITPTPLRPAIDRMAPVDYPTIFSGYPVRGYPVHRQTYLPSQNA